MVRSRASVTPARTSMVYADQPPQARSEGSRQLRSATRHAAVT
jgi:hypothetical protein